MNRVEKLLDKAVEAEQSVKKMIALGDFAAARFFRESATYYLDEAIKRESVM